MSGAAGLRQGIMCRKSLQPATRLRIMLLNI